MIKGWTAQRRRWVLPATAVSVLVVLVGGLGLARHATTGVSWRAGDHRLSQVAPASPSMVSDPAAALRRLAATIVDGPADHATARYEYIERTVWETDAPPASGTPTQAGGGRTIHHWTTGRSRSRTVVLDQAHPCPPQLDLHSNDLGPFDGPLSADPDALRRQLLGEPLPANAAPDLFGDISELYGDRHLPLPVRRGILRILARWPGVTVDPGVADRLGRAGVAVGWIYRPPMPFTVAKTLLFDPHTGALLASHSRTHPTPDAPPTATGGYDSYVLIVSSSYTADVDTPAVGCT
jgi:hypothetical protein